MEENPTVAIISPEEDIYMNSTHFSAGKKGGILLKDAAVQTSIPLCVCQQERRALRPPVSWLKKPSVPFSAAAAAAAADAADAAELTTAAETVATDAAATTSTPVAAAAAASSSTAASPPVEVAGGSEADSGEDEAFVGAAAAAAAAAPWYENLIAAAAKQWLQKSCCSARSAAAAAAADGAAAAASPQTFVHEPRSPVLLRGSSRHLASCELQQQQQQLLLLQLQQQQQQDANGAALSPAAAAAAAAAAEPGMELNGRRRHSTIEGGVKRIINKMKKEFKNSKLNCESDEDVPYETPTGGAVKGILLILLLNFQLN
ncbi:hypothetical protein, conserved [Eimeria tenella]|uniref:Uncharacterized protein n=1 Tax=Eimeria tenella TaxID=5802 RepID=U6L3V6_EIMTE|nr:hypothetical protein, conserved [Eimeria tenella]CDJ42415.1 hypothetical protein, conserved [Eimeria tenella]|eukprot:XP_013233165.1 hypothetical protein, conserved [Eimeria tenella]